MSKRRTVGSASAGFEPVIEALRDELTNGVDNPGSPVILEERSPLSSNVGVTVVWERWQTVPLDQRSAIILEAYRRAGLAQPTSDFPLGISLALGLTPDEANRLGIQY
jgi:hypothetical protein